MRDVEIQAVRSNLVAIVPKETTEDAEIGSDGLALISYLLGKPQNWKLQPDDIKRHFKWSRYRYRRTMRLLKEQGYAVMKSFKNKDGKYCGRRWIVSDIRSSRGSTEERSVRGLGCVLVPKKVIQTRRPSGQRRDGFNLDVDSHDIERWCHLLKDHLIKQRVYDKNTSIKRWCQIFRRLRNDVGKDRITTTLTYYTKNYKRGNQFQPRIFGAKDFAMKFYKIEDWMQRQQAVTGEDDGAEVKRQHQDEWDELDAMEERIQAKLKRFDKTKTKIVK